MKKNPSNSDIGWWYELFKANTPKRLTIQCRCRVVGVSMGNRQALISQLKEGEPLLLKRDAHNLHDKNAVIVARMDGQQIGFLPQEDAARYSSALDALGGTQEAAVANIVGGYAKGIKFGVRISFGLPSASAGFDKNMEIEDYEDL